MSTEPETPLVRTYVDGSTGHLVLNRPGKLNALTAELLSQFDTALAKLLAAPSVRCIIVRGAGSSFSAGYDIGTGKALAGLDEHDPEPGDEPDLPSSVADWARIRSGIERWLRVWQCAKPVVAAVHGYCLGGATQLAVCCDLTVVASDAVIGWPALPLGAGLLGPTSAWLIGPKKAKELSFIAGSRMTGAEAHQLGWANCAVSADQVLPTAARLAAVIGRTPPELLALKKQAINKVMDVQGFSGAVMAGAEFDALAHASADARAVRAKISQLGWRAAADWYQGQVPQGEDLAPD
jgi:enoyl-CoA hydratase